MYNYRITTIGGIPIRVNISLLLFLPVLAWLIGSGVQIELYAGLIETLSGVALDVGVLRAGNTPWLVGAVAALGLFASVGIHELGHSWAARRYGIETESITLWILGGLASLKEMPKEWNREFWIAVAGPITSVLTGGVCFLVLLALPASMPVVAFVFGWLFVTNVFLAVFNMVPAFPMDGGRVLRSLLARNRPYGDATRIAARLGAGFAILFAIFGVLAFSPILLLLALFLYSAATGESRVVALEAALDGIAARDLVEREPATVDAEESVATLTERMLQERRTSFTVLDGGDVVGIVTLENLRTGDDEQLTPVRDVMVTGVSEVAADTPAFEVVVEMGGGDAGVAVVMDGDDVVGQITATSLGEFLQFREETRGLKPRVAA
jgi:Zn-dependent protease/CBS domain-containing protein